jgi:hypothetical protein
VGFGFGGQYELLPGSFERESDPPLDNHKIIKRSQLYELIRNKNRITIQKSGLLEQIAYKKMLFPSKVIKVVIIPNGYMTF